MTRKSDPAPFDSVKPNPNVISRRLGDEIVLFHLDSDRFYELNGTAARFWELLSEQASSARVFEDMVREFNVGHDQLIAEANSLIASLRQENLVTSNE